MIMSRFVGWVGVRRNPVVTRVLTMMMCAPPELTLYQKGVSEPADLYGVG